MQQHQRLNILSLLNHFGSAWTGLRRSTCLKLTHGTTGQTELLTLSCLDRQRDDVAVLLTVLADPDTTIVANAGAAAADLEPPDHCLDDRALARMPKPPADPQARKEAEVLRLQLASATTWITLGRAQKAADILRSLLPRIEQLNYAPLLARALVQLGRAQKDAATANQALDTFVRADEVAEGAGLDGIALTPAALAAVTLAADLGQPEKARWWMQRAQVLLRRSGGGAFHEATIESALAAIASCEGNDREQLAHASRALALRDQSSGHRHPFTLRALIHFGAANVAVQRDAEAIEPLTRAINEREGLYSVQNSQGVLALDNLAVAAARLGRWTQSQDLFQRAEDILGKVVPDDRRSGAEHMLRVARLRLEQRNSGAALALARQAQPALLELLGARNAPLARALATEGEALEQQGQSAAARAVLTRAISMFETSQSAEVIDLVNPLTHLAAAQNDLGQSLAARPLAERAIKLLEAHQAAPGQRAAARFQLARALGGPRRNLPQAAELARQAGEEWGALPWKQAERAQVDAWLQGRGRRAGR